MSNVTRQKKVKGMPGERWKLIETPRPTLKMEYYVSNKGRIKSKSKSDGSEHILNPTADKKNYLKSSIKLEGGSYGLYVHMQVAKYWSKRPKGAQYTRYIHKDLNRLNNSSANIVWVTEEQWKEYVKARAKKFGYKPHRKGGKPKLTVEEVTQIKQHLVDGDMPKSKIAAEFNVSHTQINRIQSGENWAHVKVKGFRKKSPKRRPAAKKAAPTAKKAAPAKKAAAKKAAPKRAAAKTTAAKKTVAKKAAAKKTAPARKTAAKKTAAKKTVAKKAAPAKKAAAKKAAPAKKAAAKKTTAKKATTSKKAATTKKAAAKKAAPAKKTAAKKTAAKKTTAKKATAKKAAPKKTTRKKK